MVEPVIYQSLIVASSGLIGSLIGFGGSLLVSRRAENIARTQVIYTRAYERREEILSTLYTKFSRLDETLYVTYIPLLEKVNGKEEADGSTEEVIGLKENALRLIETITDDLQEILFYRERHSIWFSTEMLEQTYELFSAYKIEVLQRFTPMVRQMDTASRQQMIDETKARRGYLYNDLLKLRADVQKVLHIVN